MNHVCHGGIADPGRQPLEQEALDRDALDEIAQTLNSGVWSPDIIQQVAEIVAGTGRVLFDPFLDCPPDGRP